MIMTVKELIQELSKKPPQATIVITGCYGSKTNDFEVVHIPEDERKHYYSVKKDTDIVCLQSDLCSG